jgi:integrase
MQAKLTQTLVANIQPGAKDQSIIDASLPGFELRVRPTGAKVWVYRYRILDGAQKRMPLGGFPGLSATEARKLALVAAGDVARGIDICARKREAREESARKRESTLKAFLENRYEPYAKAQLKSGAEQVARIRADFADWFDRPLVTLDKALVDEWRNKQLLSVKLPVTINRDLQRLQSLLSKAVEWKVIPHHPFAGLKPLRHDKTGRVRYLCESEESQLREALLTREARIRKTRDTFNEWRKDRHLAPLPARTEEFIDHLRPLVLTGLNTGLRRGELFNLRVKDLDFASRWLTVRGVIAKSGQSRRIPLNTEAHAVLEAWCKQLSNASADSYVFTGPTGKRLTRVDKAWRALMKLSKISNFRFHDMRHHFASRLVQAGVDLNTVRELLGHKDIEMVLRYAHLAPNNLSSAVEKISRSPHGSSEIQAPERAAA